jgi:maleate cis-trans isomerase
MYFSPAAPWDGATVRLGVLYPSSAAEDDYGHLAERLGDRVAIDLVHTTIGEDAHREDALRDTGDVRRLLRGAEDLRGRGVAAAMWACTSGSFVFGLEGAVEQAAALERAVEVPASSTSLAFVAALQHLGIGRVAVAATYPEDVTQMFVGLLADAGVETVGGGSLGIITGTEVGGLGRPEVLDLVATHDRPAAEAVLLPDTALHSVAWLDELEEAAGKPVLTANQVTAWWGLRLAGGDIRKPGLGTLFEAERSPGERAGTDQ